MKIVNGTVMYALYLLKNETKNKIIGCKLIATGSQKNLNGRDMRNEGTLTSRAVTPKHPNILLLRLLFRDQNTLRNIFRPVSLRLILAASGKAYLLPFSLNELQLL